MLKTVEGIFRGGKVELRESLPAKEGDQVLVTLLTPERPKGNDQIMTFGMLRTEGGREATWEDFEEAKRAMFKAIEEFDGPETRR